MSGITLKEVAPAVIPTPDSGKDTIFIDSTSSNTPAYKDSAGVTHSLVGAAGATGATGAAGANGPPGYGEQGDDGDFLPIPGPQGPQGATGAAGPAGSSGGVAAILLEDTPPYPDEQQNNPHPLTDLSNFQPFAGFMRAAWVHAFNGSSTGVGVTQETPVNASNLIDTAGAWQSLTSAVSGQVSAWGFNNLFSQPGWNIIFVARVRTGASIANIRLWCGVKTSDFTDSDTMSSAGVAFRFSTVAGDTGWVGVTNDGTQAVTGLIGAALQASTIYVLKIRMSATSVVFSVNGGTEVIATTHIPATTTVTARAAMIPQTAATRAFDINVMGMADVNPLF